MSRRGDDFLLSNSRDGKEWAQMRIAHLHELRGAGTVRAGIYCCSPSDGQFDCVFESLAIGENRWLLKESN